MDRCVITVNASDAGALKDGPSHVGFVPEPGGRH
jgi:hypothetical protein